jgi:two-component system sensor histidine kinase BaeS
MRRVTLSLQVFLSIVLVALGTAVTVGLFARSALSTAFDHYLASLPRPGGMGRGRMMLGAAEQAFVASVDRSVVIAAVVAVLVATAVALLLAAYLNRPLRRLEVAAEEIAGGDLSHRVESQGPAEVAAIGDAFNRMADSLEEAEALRRRLVADVAHELRNPIAAARLQAEGMAEGVLPADPTRLASLVEDLQHLSGLVDDLQELATAEAGKLTYQMRDIDIAEIIERESTRAGSAAPASIVVKTVGTDAPVVIRGDERRIAQVLRNLLSNSLRHTELGSIVIEATADGQFVRVTVTDTGEGIPAAELPHIFERFFRADAARAAHTGGAGLGLAITRSIVRDHGGDVFASSTLGEGTTVGFTLPRAS